MIYTFRCSNCGVEEDLQMTVKDYEALKAFAFCNDCKAPALQVIKAIKAVFMRSPFPKGFSEHISENGHFIRDKKEAIDVAAQNGLTSVYCENLT